MKSVPEPEWSKILRPGQRIFIGSGASCPLALIESMLPYTRQVGDLELVQGLVLGPAPWTEARYQAGLRVNAFYLDPRLSSLVNAGMDEYTPAHYSEIPALFRERIINLDIALVMVSPPDEYGFCSLGPTVEWHPSAIESAHIVIAQVNPEMPRSGGLGFVHYSEFDYALVHAQELAELTQPQIEPEYNQIGDYVAQLIQDGDTLQMGVGPVGRGLVAALHGHRHLGIHSEVIGDGVMELFRKGVVDNTAKSLLPGKVIAAQAMGSRELYRFLDGNPHFEMRPTDFVSNPLTIARNKRMVAVNSALQVDLTGQVVVDSVKGLFRSGVGSTVDFVRGAAMSTGGRPIIALPSTGTDDAGLVFSRIVAELPAGAGVGCQRTDVHYVVTEYGIATLRGRTIQERVQELIQIAHPDFREGLVEMARRHHLVPDYFQLAAPYSSEEHGIRTRRLKLKDERFYILRPLNPSDDRRLQEFFYSHTEETIVRRYGFTLTRMSRERAFELVGVNQNRDLALGVFELQGPRQVIHSVGRYYLDTDGKGGEMAFVVSEQKRRLGMAKTLMREMIAIARKRGLKNLWAQVDRNNLPMLKLFRSFDCTEQAGDDNHTLRIEIPL